MTTDEKLEALWEQYPDWEIGIVERLNGITLRRWRASATYQETRHSKTPEAALDALAEALAKPEGKCPKCGWDLSCTVCNYRASHGMDKEGG